MKVTAMLVGLLVSAHTAGAVTTVVEQSPYLKHPGFLGTREYVPLQGEVSFFERLSEDAKKTVDGYSVNEEAFFESNFFKSSNPTSSAEERKKEEPKFSILGRSGEYVSWFGIVRSVVKTDGGVRLILQNKYSTGQTDCHIQTVSIYGGGDFAALVEGGGVSLPPLCLARVYGVVSREADGMPEIAVEYLRYWRWMDFNFSDYGRDAGRSQFDRTIDRSKLRIYSARVTGNYYAERIEATEEQKTEVMKWWEANLQTVLKEREDAERVQPGTTGNPGGAK